MSETTTSISPRRIALQLARVAQRGDGVELWEDAHLVPFELVEPTFEEMRSTAQTMLAEIGGMFDRFGDRTSLVGAANLLQRLAIAEAAIYLEVPTDSAAAEGLGDSILASLLKD